jgi:hypothetical protein
MEITMTACSTLSVEVSPLALTRWIKVWALQHRQAYSPLSSQQNGCPIVDSILAKYAPSSSESSGASTIAARAASSSARIARQKKNMFRGTRTREWGFASTALQQNLKDKLKLRHKIYLYQLPHPQGRKLTALLTNKEVASEILLMSIQHSK